MSDALTPLKRVLYLTYALYLKTQSYHWNVKGVGFYQFHKLFEDQYSDLAEAIDVIAERVRSLGSPVEISFTILSSDKTFKLPNHLLSSDEMVKDLLEDNKSISEIILSTINKFENDPATADILTQRLEVHQKNCWFLQSSIAN